MEMIQNAMMFQDAAPVGLPQPVRGAGSAPRTSDGGGSFAEVLQGKQPSRDDAAAKADPRENDAGQSSSPSPGAPNRLGKSPDSPASAAHVEKPSQPAASDQATSAQAGQAEPKKGPLGGALRFHRWQEAQLPVADSETSKLSTGKNAGAVEAPVVPENAKGGPDLGTMLADLQGKSLAEQTQENAESTATLTATTQQAMAAVLLAAAETAGTSRVPTDAALTNLELKDAAAVIPAPTQGPMGEAMAVAQSDAPALKGAGFIPVTGNAADPEYLESEAAGLEKAQSLASLSKEKRELFTKGQRIEQGNIPAAATPVQDTTSTLGEPVPQAEKTWNQEGAQAPQTKPNPVSSGANNEQIVVLKKGPDLASLDGSRTASPVAVPDALQNAKPQGPALPVLNADAGTEQQAAQLEAASAVATASADPVAQGRADGKVSRAAEGTAGSYAAARGVTEQKDTGSQATVEDLGIKTAPVVGTGKSVPSHGSAGQGGFSDADKKGHPEQKAQANEGAQVQTQGIGLTAPAAAEAQQAETKPASLKNALHESILSQVKQGVVTHDGKGNGQMSIRLNPGELGELKIQVRMEDNRLRVEVQADNRMVKDLLMSNLDSLKDSLTSKNFTMEGFDVSTGGGGFNSPLSEEKGSPQQQAFLRSARAGAYPDQGEEGKVNYLTGEVNNLLDVRF